jgi:hypothetical protein
MSDGLRTRLAAAIYTDNPFGWSRDQCEHAADAAIRELGLDKEFGCPVAGHHHCRCSHRYTTEWEDNDE